MSRLNCTAASAGWHKVVPPTRSACSSRAGTRKITRDYTARDMATAPNCADSLIGKYVRLRSPIALSVFGARIARRPFWRVGLVPRLESGNSASRGLPETQRPLQKSP